MTERIDLVYDRLVAEEKLKRRSKCERLAAIAFQAPKGRDHNPRPPLAG